MIYRKLKIFLLALVWLLFMCSNFNNPIEPTHVLGYHYYNDSKEIVIFGGTVRIGYFDAFNMPEEKDTPVVTLHLKTDTDFSKKYSPLNKQNSTYMYQVYRDSITNFQVIKNYYRIILLSIGSGASDTSYYQFPGGYHNIDIPLNGDFMKYPKQFLWQAQVNENEVSVLPPEPYAYIVE